MWCTTNEMETWIKNQVEVLKKTEPSIRFDRIIYWRQEVESCVRVDRNYKEMHEEFVPVFKDVWKQIVYHRATGGKELNYVEVEEQVVEDEIPYAFADDSDAD